MTTVSTSMTVQSTQYAAPTTGQTVSVTQSRAPEISIVINPAGALAALTIALPTGGMDGQKISIMTSQAITTVTLTTASGSIIGGVTTLAANGFVTFVWISSQTKWFRIG